MSLKRLFVIVGLIAAIGLMLDHTDKLVFSKQENGNWEIEATAAVMMDAQTGKWLYRNNASEPLAPASMSKMMSELVTLDGIRSGDLDWSDEVSVSSYAAQVGGAGMGLAEGQSATVRSLFDAMAIHSANDAAVALAEHIAGSEAEFVERMNVRAGQIGLSSDSYFANATGLPSRDLSSYPEAAAKGETVMTAEDVAILAYYLVSSYPEVLKVTRNAYAEVEGTEQLQNTNEMLPGQRFGTAGNDGLKTGYTMQAGYCFTGTTVVEGRRYITVVMGTSTPEARFEETKRLLELGLSGRAS